MNSDEYWNKFLKDGTVQSYLNYKEHLRSQGRVEGGTDTVYGRRTDNTGKGYR